jgi:hypothetical protein
MAKHIPPLWSAHDVKEAEHGVRFCAEVVQNDELPVASFIAVWMLLRQVDDSDAQTEPELMTAYDAPACAAAFTCISRNIPVPRSVMPSVKIKKTGEKIAASTAAAASQFLAKRHTACAKDRRPLSFRGVGAAREPVPGLRWGPTFASEARGHEHRFIKTGRRRCSWVPGLALRAIPE